MFEQLPDPGEIQVPDDALQRAKATGTSRLRRRYAIVSAAAAVLLAAIAVPLVREDATQVNTSGANDPNTLTPRPLAIRLACSYGAVDAQLEPVDARDRAVWSPEEARDVIAAATYFTRFEPARLHLWLARYSGTIPNPLTYENHLTASTTLTDQLVWLAVVDDVPLTLSGKFRPNQETTSSTSQLLGHASAAFVDGWAPAQSVSGLSLSTKPPPSCPGEAISDIRPGLHIEIDAPATGKAGELIDIRARVRDDEGDLHDVETRFGDETKPPQSGGFDLVCRQSGDDPSPREAPADSPQHVKHAYRTAGTYEITVSARTGGCFAESESITATTSITITGSTTRTNGPTQPEAMVGHEYFLNGDPSRLITDITGWDRDGFVYRLVLDWGDGTDPYVVERPFNDCDDTASRWPPFEPWLQRSPSHRYARDGSYTLTVQAFSAGCDGGSRQEATKATIRVTSPPAQGS